MPSGVPKAIFNMLNSAHTEGSVFPPTHLYNEGWMLRLILFYGASGIHCLPFSFHSESKWFTEPMLYTPFHARHRGDRLAETHTHADGVVAEFRFMPETKIGFELVPDSKQFIVIEAKMYSVLSEGTTNAPFYDQVVRTVACMAETINRSGKQVDEFESLGFFIMAPKDQIDQGVFSEYIEKPSILQKVQWRVEAYHQDEDFYSKLQVWFQNVFKPLIERIDIRCWPWETAVYALNSVKPNEGSIVKAFYKRCLEYNQ